jgi:hypothetical protein
LDEFFSTSNPSAEIVWKRVTAHGDSKRWGNVHDYILWKTKSDQFVWYPQFEPYSKDYIEEKYNNVLPDDRRYMLDNMTSPNPRPNMMYDWRGHKAPRLGWRYEFDTMERLFAEGRIELAKKKGGRPRLRRFLDEMPGVPVGSVSVHIQDEIGFVPERGNLFLTNIHRVYESGKEPSFDDDDTTDYFLGKKPVNKTTDSRVDLSVIIRDVNDLVILNDEAHHIHDPSMAWFQSIQDITVRLRQKGSDLSAQFDLTATPRHNDGSIFVQTISDYPLVEAIRQEVVKTPVLPDEASRAKLTEHKSSKFTEQYADYLHLGYLEWKKSSDELAKMEKKAVLFVMTDDTRNCDEVANYLQERYQELDGAVLVIHTKNNGEISEASSGKTNEELNVLREQSMTIDGWDSKHKAVVSVMVLREGWDVQNVTIIVGLRPYTSKAKILPEQTLGRGLRRMFRGQGIDEKVSGARQPSVASRTLRKTSSMVSPSVAQPGIVGVSARKPLSSASCTTWIFTAAPPRTENENTPGAAECKDGATARG